MVYPNDFIQTFSDKKMPECFSSPYNLIKENIDNCLSNFDLFNITLESSGEKFDVYCCRCEIETECRIEKLVAYIAKEYREAGWLVSCYSNGSMTFQIFIRINKATGQMTLRT